MHVAFGELVALGFSGGGFSDNSFKLFKRGATTEGFAEVYLILAEEAETELAVGSEAESVTLIAEVFSDGGEKTDGTVSAGEAEVFSGSIAFVYLMRLHLT